MAMPDCVLTPLVTVATIAASPSAKDRRSTAAPSIRLAVSHLHVCHKDG
jgi:hypothetical protein